MTENNKVTFKIFSIYPGQDPRAITMESVDRNNGTYRFMDVNGNINDRNKAEGEKVATLVLSSVENFDFPNGAKNRVFTKVSYIPNAMEYYKEQGLKGTELSAAYAQERYFENMHLFLKTHPLVIIKKNGHNINPNLGLTAGFELVEESILVREEVEKNIRSTEARAKATELYKKSKELFVDFCYSYGIYVGNTPVEKLFNEVILKIEGNPEYFFEVINHKDAELLTLFNKALQKTNEETGNAVIAQVDDFYEFEDEFIGQSEQEVLYYFTNNPKKLENLKRRLGVKVTPVVVTELGPDSADVPPQTARQVASKRAYDAKMVADMEDEVHKAAKQYGMNWAKADKAKNDEAKVEHAKDFLGKMKAIKEKFAQIPDAVETRVGKAIRDCQLENFEFD